MTWWIWVLLGLFLLTVEVMIPGGVILLFFGSAAIVVGVLVATGVAGPIWLQWLLFSGLSIVSLLTLRGPILRKMKVRTTNDVKIDSLVGEQALIIEDLPPGAEGKAELRGTSWVAKNIGERPLAKGETCIIDRVHSLKLFVRSS